MLDLKPSISLAPTQLGVKTPSVGLAKLLHGVEKSNQTPILLYLSGDRVLVNAQMPAVFVNLRLQGLDMLSEHKGMERAAVVMIL